MLSNVSDDLASGMEGDRRLLTYCYVLTKNAILGMHLAFFVGRKGVHIVSLLAGTRGGLEAATVACFLFHILILRVWISWKKRIFFHFWSEVRGDVRFYTRPVTEENNGFARESRSHWSTVGTFVMF